MEAVAVPRSSPPVRPGRRDQGAVVVEQVSVVTAIRGLIPILAVLALMRGSPPAAWTAVSALVATTLAVAVVEVYAETVGEALQLGRRLTGHEVRRIWDQVAPVLVWAQLPTVALLLAAFGFIPVGTAIELGHVLLLTLLFGYGMRGGRLLEERPGQQILRGAQMVAIGGAIVGIEALALSLHA